MCCANQHTIILNRPRIAFIVTGTLRCGRVSNAATQLDTLVVVETTTAVSAGHKGLVTGVHKVRYSLVGSQS